MIKTTENHLLPMIVVGKNLQQMYNESEPKRKKIIAIKAGIEDSNMRASLNTSKNISKHTFRKIATGMDVCPILFYVSRDIFEKDYLESQNEESVLYLKDFVELSQVLSIPKTTEEMVNIIEEEVLQAMDTLKEKIHTLEKMKLQHSVDKKSVIQTMIELSILIKPNYG
jgi:hypothetical protein